jgi:HAMP domain-containing protein
MPELEGQPDADVQAHLAGCAVCNAVLNDQRALAAGLRAAAVDWRRTKAPGRMEGMLLAAFRGQAGLAAPPPARHWWSTALAWTAAALVVAGAFLLFTNRARQVQPPVNQSAATELAAIDWSARLPAELTAEGGGEGFIPVPNADRLPPNEDLNVVRVEVPRSAMIALGYSVTADRAAERVRADVLLGSDGLARAVRFLDE